MLELEECRHPTVMKDMCAECGADLTKLENNKNNASVSMVHTVPELKISHEVIFHDFILTNLYLLFSCKK